MNDVLPGHTGANRVPPQATAPGGFISNNSRRMRRGSLIGTSGRLQVAGVSPEYRRARDCRRTAPSPRLGAVATRRWCVDSHGDLNPVGATDSSPVVSPVTAGPA